MQINWLRLSFALIAAGAVSSSVIIACSSDNSGTPSPNQDGGTSQTDSPSTGPDGSKLADGQAGGDSALPAHGRVILVHASGDLPGVRFCFGTGAMGDGSDETVAALPALPNSAAGLPPGTGGMLPDLIDLSKVAVTGFVILAPAIVSETGDAGLIEKNCQALVGMTGTGGTLTLNQDYFRIKTVPKGTFASGTTSLIAITGCGPSTKLVPDTQECGSDYNSTTGNVSAQLYPNLDRNVPDPTKAGIQVVDLAVAWDNNFAAASSATGAAETMGLASALDTPAGAGITVQVPQLKPAVAQSVTGLGDGTLTQFYFQTTFTNDAGPIGPLWWPLDTIAKLSNGTGTSPDGGRYFSNGTNYTFILMGNNLPKYSLLGDGGLASDYEPHEIHVIAFDNNMTPPVFP